MKKLFLIFLIYGHTLQAETIPLPPAVSTINDIVNEFRNALTTKISELGKNFIAQSTDKTILFTNSSTLNCHADVILKGEPVSSMQYNFKKVGMELIEKAIYTGCGNQIALVEDVVTRGGKLEPLKYNDFVKGKRDFELNDDESYRLYRVSNAENEEIFKMLIEKSEKTKLVEFFILGQKFLRMNYDYQLLSTKLTLTYYGYKANYVRSYANWGVNRSFDAFMNSVSVTKGPFNQVKYLDENGAQISQTEYLSLFNKMIVSGTLGTIRQIFDYHNYYFPTTKIVQTGSINQHLKEELRLVFNRLQNNTELNLVKKQIQDYIEAAENGLIIDNRPKQ